MSRTGFPAFSLTSLSRPVTCAILAMAGSGQLVACAATPVADSESVSSRVASGAEAVQARAADTFVDATCVATHFTYYDTVYGSRYAEVRDKLFALGARHVREGGDGADVVSKIRELASGGVTTIYVMDPNGGVKPSHDYWSNPNKATYLVNDFVKMVGTDAIDGVEVMNEVDLFYPYSRWRPGDATSLSDAPDSDRYWANYIREVTKDTSKALRGDPATAGMPVYGPSFTSEPAYATVGDLCSSIDAVSIHHYWGARHPGSDGWGDNGYGSMPWIRSFMADKQCASKPYVVTEGGYANAVNKDTHNPPEALSGKYMARMYMLFFKNGAPRVCTYELVDERPNPEKNDNEAHFGLLRNDLSEKPAYKALKNMNAVLSDRGGKFTPGSLAYSLSGNTDGVERILLQKRDGRYFLALWIEESSYEPNTGARIDVPDRALTVTLPASIATATLHALNDDGEMVVSAGDLANGKLRLTVTDRITLVELAASGGGGADDVSAANEALNACVARNGGPAAAGSAVDSGGGAGVHRWGSGDVQDFAGGSFGPTICMLRENSETAWMVRGAIRDVYFAAGGAAGWLGYPVEDEHGANRGPLQRFENGYITQEGAHFAAFAGSP